MTTYADDELLTIDEATEYLGVTKRRCYQRRWQQIGPREPQAEQSHRLLALRYRQVATR